MLYFLAMCSRIRKEIKFSSDFHVVGQGSQAIAKIVQIKKLNLIELPANNGTFVPAKANHHQIQSVLGL